MHEPFYPAYLIGECIDQREREESVMVVLCAEALKTRKRGYKEVRSRNFVYSLLNITQDQVPVDIATSLVVNHVNIGVLCLFVLCLCLWLWRSYRSKIIHKHLKDWITVGS